MSPIGGKVLSPDDAAHFASRMTCEEGSSGRVCGKPMVCFVKLMALPGSVAVCSTCNGFYAKSGDNVKRYRLVARLEEIP